MVCEDKCVRERKCTPDACSNVVRNGTCNTDHYRPMCQKSCGFCDLENSPPVEPSTSSALVPSMPVEPSTPSAPIEPSTPPAPVESSTPSAPVESSTPSAPVESSSKTEEQVPKDNEILYKIGGVEITQTDSFIGIGLVFALAFLLS